MGMQVAEHKCAMASACKTSFLHCAGRIRKKGEMNGKSGNMNNVLAQIYPTGCFIPGNELIAVFDADQIAKPDFFLRTVSLFDAGDDVGMVSSCSNPTITISTRCFCAILP